MKARSNIYPGHTCHWESWFSARVTFVAGEGYKNCELDHGKRGELETIMMRTLFASAGGPVLGIHDAITKMLEMMEGNDV